MPTRKARGQTAATTRRRIKTNGSRPTRGLRPDTSRTAPPRSHSTQEDAIALLKADHDKVRGLLSELEKTEDTAGRRREQLLATIEQEIKVHSKIEQDVFYPAYRAAAKTTGDRRVYYEALEEHHVVDLVLPEIKNTDTDSIEFAAKAKVLKDLIEHHAGEEENEMFPRARRLMDGDELARLGEQLAKAKQSLTGGVIRKLAGLVGL